MTEPHHEPSYYEIALTNRQVVVAFVALLIVLLSVFFSGVWIGRGGIEPRHDQVAKAAPPPAPPAEGRSVEELKFFTDKEAKKTPPEAPSEKKVTPEKPAPVETGEKAEGVKPGNTGNTLQENPKPAKGTPTPAPTRATPPPVPRETESAAIPVSPAPTPEPRAAEKPATEKTEKEKKGKAGAENAGATGAIIIQVFASADQAEAKRVRERLVKGGQAASISPLTTDGRTMYRVRIGPFTSRPKAQKVAESVRKKFKLDTWLTE